MTDLDCLAAEALRVCEDVRVTVPADMHTRLVALCRTTPEHAARLLAVLAVWVDVDNPTSLADRAEEVSAALAELQARTAPPREWREVTLSRDVRTDTGVLPRGSHRPATPVEGGQWLVKVTESRAVRVPETWVRGGKKVRVALLQKRDAHEEYWFARRELGYGHEAAVQWLIDAYGTTDRQLFRWGISLKALEVSA